MRRLVISFFLVFIAGLFFLFLYNHNKIKEYEKSYTYFDGINIKLYTNRNCDKIFEQIDNIFKNYEDDSLLEYGLSVKDLTQGYVDIYKGSIIDIYNKSKEENIKPIYKNNNTINYDLIKKSFVINKIKIYLEDNNINSYIINMRDNYLLGDSKGVKFTFALEKPFTDDYLMFLDLNNVAISSVGPYLDYYVLDNNIYHKLVNPFTLKECNNYKSITVIGDDILKTEPLAHLLYFLSIDEGKEILKQYNYEAIWYTNDDKLEYTEKIESWK